MPRKPLPQSDAGGREFAGETGLAESTSGPRVTGPPAVRPLVRPPGTPRPPRGAEPPAPAPAPRAPDPTVAGSQYFAAKKEPARESPRDLPAFGRDGDIDSDADELAVDEDLGALTRRKDRERASQNAASKPHQQPAHEPLVSSTRRDSDAEAGARDLDHASPDIHRRRRDRPQ